MYTSQKDIGEQGHASSYKVKQLHCHSIGRIKPVQLVVHHVGQISGCRWPQEQRRSAVSGVLLVVALVVLRIQCCSNRGAGHNAWTNVEAGSLLSECWSRHNCRRSLDTCLWRFLMRWRPPRTLTCQQLRLLSSCMVCCRPSRRVCVLIRSIAALVFSAFNSSRFAAIHAVVDIPDALFLSWMEPYKTHWWSPKLLMDCIHCETSVVICECMPRSWQISTVGWVVSALVDDSGRTVVPFSKRRCIYISRSLRCSHSYRGL